MEGCFHKFSGEFLTWSHKFMSIFHSIFYQYTTFCYDINRNWKAGHYIDLTMLTKYLYFKIQFGLFKHLTFFQTFSKYLLCISQVARSPHFTSRSEFSEMHISIVRWSISAREGDSTMLFAGFCLGGWKIIINSNKKSFSIYNICF